jgi:hypothetical protein
MNRLLAVAAIAASVTACAETMQETRGKARPDVRATALSPTSRLSPIA